MYEELLAYDSEDEESDDAMSVDNLVISLKAELCELIQKKNPIVRPAENLNNTSMLAHQRTIKLPKLNPPQFFGNYHDWLDFKNEFTSMIIEDGDLNDVDRFRILKSCLTGAAQQTVSKMEASKENFNSSWNALRERYENKSLIFQCHINEIIQMPAVSKESATALRDMIDKTCAHYRALLNLGSKDELAENILIAIVLS